MRAPAQETSLFPTQERARRRRTDPITSFWAAQGIDCNRRQGMVLAAFIKGDATHEDLIERVREIYPDSPVADSTVRTGCSELMEKGLVESLGAIGRTKFGKTCNVYRRVNP